MRHGSSQFGAENDITSERQKTRVLNVGNKKCENLPKNMKTPSSTFSFFLSESEEESCRGVAEAAAAAMADKTRKEQATREWGSCMQ
jgi:hypothetical protein